MAAHVGTTDGAVAPSARTRRLRRIAAAVALLVAVDQLTKAWAVAALSDGPVEVIGDVIRFNLTRNAGGAFGNFQGFTPILAGAALLTAVLLVRTVTRTTDRWTLVALTLVLAGALGNLVDRLARAPGFMRGRVVDFVDIGSFPIFNVADSCITIGVGLLLWRGFAGDRRG